MVTDGEETCAGDPCRVAGELNAAEIALTTHVVGFALTDEQREAVACIAEDGGGELIGQGATLSIFPYVVVDGGVAFGNLYFGVGQLPEGAEYDDVEVASQPRSDDPLFFDTTVEEATVQEDGRIIGIVRNDHEQDVSNLRPAVACFDEAGELLEVGENVLGAADTSLAAGDETTVAFTLERGGFGLTGPCPAFLFAAQAQAALP